MNKKPTAPFPYFGGKGSIAPIVWRVLGDVKHYIEPFFGSGAVLLQRPDYDPQRHIETVNDADGHLCNVWRSLQFAPDETAKWCDWPVNHADLSARKAAIIKNESRLLENLMADSEWCDPKMAGYWIWAVSCWIGHGLTGVHKIGKIPHLADAGKGVHKIGQIPRLSDAGVGVHKPYNTNIYKWFRELSERLRHVRVVCGDWSRVCGGNWQNRMGIVGIFFDPPYSAQAGRDNDLYHNESLDVAHDVRAWCIERGDKPSYRIVLAGYVGEHEELLKHGWKFHNWTAGGGYSNQGKKKVNDNRKREILWFSPHCLNVRNLPLLDSTNEGREKCL